MCVSLGSHRYGTLEGNLAYVPVMDPGIGSGRDPEPVTEFQQLSQVVRTWIEFSMERDRRRDRDVPLTSHTVQGVNVPLNDFMKLAPPIFAGMDSSEVPR